MIQAAKRWLKKSKSLSKSLSKSSSLPLIKISASQHQIMHSSLNRRALNIIKDITAQGFEAYLVGGSLRDLLCHLDPKDYDIATVAHPEQVHKIFRNSRIIGKRFRLVHVFFGREIIEVATFRTHHEPNDRSLHGMVTRQNVYGTLEEDVLRRDFTINALYYDIHHKVILDYVDGFSDIQNQHIRLIGDPADRYREDPVRMLRAIRFAAKTGFQIEASTQAPIKELSSLLGHISAARLYEEMQKLFFSGHAVTSLHLLQHYHLFKYLFGATYPYLEHSDDQKAVSILLEKLCENTDQRIAEGKRVTSAFFMAVMLWYPFLTRLKQIEEQPGLYQENVIKAMKEVLREQHRQTTLPAYVSGFIQDIWMLQFRLIKLRPKNALSLIHLRAFRAAFDFLILRAYLAKQISPLGENAENLEAIVQFWEQFQQADLEEQKLLIKKFPGQIYTSKKRKKRPFKKDPS